jgi:hypothetical protein
MTAILTLRRSLSSSLWLAATPLAALPALALEPKWAIFYIAALFVAVPIALTVRDAKLWIFLVCLLSPFYITKVIADPAGGSEHFLAIGVALIDVPLVVLVAVALARSSSGGAVKVRFTAAAGAVLLLGCTFLAWAGFSALQSVQPELTVAYLVIYLRMLLCLAALAACANDGTRLRWGLYGLFLALVVQSVLAAVQWGTGDSFGLYKHFEEETSRGRLIRAGGTLNPTVLSEFIGIVAPLVLATSFIVARRLVSWALLGVFALGVAASVLTFSRAGVVSLALSTFIVLGGALLERAVPRSRKVVVAVGVGSVAVLLSVYFAASMLARVDAISTDTVGDESRLAQMRQAVAMIGEKPLLGTGLGLYRLHMGQHGPVLDFPVHNKYLNVTAEAGIPGGLLYLSLWLATLWIFARRARRTAGAERMFFVGAVAAIVATLANMNTDVYGAGGAPEMALFVLTGLGLGYASRPPEYPAFSA